MEINVGAIPVASLMILSALLVWWGRHKLLAFTERSRGQNVPKLVRRHYSKIIFVYIVILLALAGGALFANFD